MPKKIFQQVIRVSGLILLLAVLAQSAFALELPPPTGSSAFLQTSGPATNLGVGDYYTSDIGEPVAANRFHRMEIYVPCAWPAGQTITFALYDPESDETSNGAIPPTNDEVRSGTNTGNITHYTFQAPGGASVNGTYNPATPPAVALTDGLWVELITFTTGTAGFGCGTYVLTNTTEGNDDNAWRLRVNHDPDCTVSPGTCSTIGVASSTLLNDGDQTNDIDGIAGTGDELVAGLTRTSYQHNGTSCQNFYQFVDGTSPTVAFNNFDLDVPTLAASITYFPPDGSTIVGTASGAASWNGSPDNSAENPNPPRAGDTYAITPALVGWWRIQVCVGPTDNQYIFEGLEGEPVFFEPVPFPNMTIGKDDGLTTVSSSGQTVTYTIQYANTGTGAALAATITDTLPTGATFVSCTGGCAGSGAGPITWSLGTVPGSPNAGSTGSVTITMQLPPAPAGSTHTNSVSIDYTDIIGNNYPPSTGTDIDTVVSVPTSPNMTTSKDDALTTVSSSGQTVTYTIQYANTGTGDAINAVITDTLPTGATFASCTGGCTGSGAGPITWSLGTVSAGSSGSVTITMQLPPAPAGSTHTNSVSISYTDGGGGNYPPATGTDIDTVTGATSPNMTTSKDDALTTVSSSGQTVTYTIQYANTGTGDAINAVITDTLPTGATFASCTGGCTGSGAGPITWSLGTVPAGSSGSVTITMQLPPAPAGSTHTNSVSISYTDGGGGNYPPATGTDVDTVAGVVGPVPTNTPAPGGTSAPAAGGTPATPASSTPGVKATATFVFVDPFITKRVEPLFSLPGEIVTWTIAVKNPGTVSISNVVVTDTLPSQVQILGTIPASSAIKVSGQTVTFTQASLAAGEEVTFQVQARVRGNIDVSRLTNRACVDFAQSTSDHCASASVSIVSQLPSTGESPWSPWRLPVFLMIVGGVGLGLLFVSRGMRAQRM